MSNAVKLRHRLGELLSGHELTESRSVLTGGGTAPVTVPRPSVDTHDAPIDRPDRSDRSSDANAQQRGRFVIGGRYKSKRLERVFSLMPGQRELLDATGFPRASAVTIEGEQLLIGDLARFMLTGDFLVLAFIDVPKDRSIMSSRTKGGGV